MNLLYFEKLKICRPCIDLLIYGILLKFSKLFNVSEFGFFYFFYFLSVA